MAAQAAQCRQAMQGSQTTQGSQAMQGSQATQGGQTAQGRHGTHSSQAVPRPHAWLWGPNPSTGYEWSSKQFWEVLKQETHTQLGTAIHITAY
ncbi:hypothetical protein KXX16_006190 [Aspergillus fumigatus]|nr:hypothetical protein KXX16_006190 [Aspergillus fumigatus]KAH1656750.1 hypothetical protein KXX65_006984 [Aspergillus fumigatus]KAH2001061.1 hypothetical protein KXV97_007101 [Aspergillus fumigatus]KAH2192308.1 hypothetical protein KXV88_006936 [Aspergillus fumigatus]KAH2214948.1 hypothetical protein KXV58_006728 [Aspergillus fumigatus]